MYTPHSMKYIAAKYSPDKEYILYGTFLDDFYGETKDKYTLIKDEPTDNNSNIAFLCKLAATAHKLAIDNGLPIPEWVFKDKYVYDGEYYGNGYKTELTDDCKTHLKETAPPEFRERNIFLGRKVMSRV